MFSFDCNTKRYYKSQRQRHSLKLTWIDCNLLNIFRSISIFILVSYRIDKNCGNDILKEQVRYYRNGVLFFKCLVLNKDLLSVRVLLKIFEVRCQSQIFNFVVLDLGIYSVVWKCRTEILGRNVCLPRDQFFQAKIVFKQWTLPKIIKFGSC